MNDAGDRTMCDAVERASAAGGPVGRSVKLEELIAASAARMDALVRALVTLRPAPADCPKVRSQEVVFAGGEAVTALMSVGTDVG